ncbi:MAG: hypothetical protein H6859_06125 [Rhodospirillales bacterium]|nr:hypothetical protein [Alphaproteobacteria bacterium]USO04743.1 MAG: hypothetical protein H6859_06125 [Rhodospirillales bacterium]
MSEKPKSDKNNDETAQGVFSAVDSVAQRLSTIEQFIARRFDEISMEINATSQQVDMAEEGIIKRFAEILEILKAVSYAGDGSTAANAGVELDAVVEMTEQAANRILDAADHLTSRIEEEKNSSTDEGRKQAFEEMGKDVEEIYMACSFQDITGQRIRKTLENLRIIEDRLGSALDKMGIQIDVNPEDHVAIKNKLSTQNDIDNFFQTKKGEN